MSSIKDKLYNYESVPPASAWDKIAAALDEEQSVNKFPGVLYNMEVPPPAPVWDRINASLDNNATDVNPGKIRSISFLRYAAAAVLIGAIAFGILRWSNSTNGNEPVAGKSVSAPEESNSTNKIVSDTPKPADINTGITITEPVQEKSQIARVDKQTRPRRNYVPPTRSSAASSALYTYDDHVPSIADRYVMLMTPDGNFIRMSKKWSNMICCVSGEEQDAECKDQLKKWQEKLAQSSMSSGNFMDILSLVNSLDEGTEL